MLCEPVCHRVSGRNQSKKKHACQADVLFVLCQGFWLFSVFRRSRLRGHRQIRRCDLHRSHRRGCRQSRRSCRLRRNRPRGCCRRSHRSFRCQSRLRGRCCRIRRRNYRKPPEGRLGCWGGRRLPPEELPLRGGLGPPCGGRGPPERGGRGPRGGRRPQKMG